MSEVRVKQVKSTAGADPKQKATLRSLGLGRIGKEVVRKDSPQLRGQLQRVSHLVEVL